MSENSESIFGSSNPQGDIYDSILSFTAPNQLLAPSSSPSDDNAGPVDDISEEWPHIMSSEDSDQDSFLILSVSKSSPNELSFNGGILIAVSLLNAPFNIRAFEMTRFTTIPYVSPTVMCQIVVDGRIVFQSPFDQKSTLFHFSPFGSIVSVELKKKIHGINFQIIETLRKCRIRGFVAEAIASFVGNYVTIHEPLTCIIPS